ncbi:BrnT family toxin [Candidatus Roizmanbacteria bacterium]|nr:BrnT family toxin [Candidatus Roizmanbacteria bacterium]
MREVKIDKENLIWDEWNVKHIRKHNIVPYEIEELLKNDYVARKTHKDRIMITGRSGKRILSVILEQEEKGYYVVTARDAGRRERRAYRDEKTKKTT